LQRRRASMVAEPVTRGRYLRSLSSKLREDRRCQAIQP
jgi:hypothetical protein